MPGVRATASARRRAAIVAAALECFTRKGVAATTVEDLRRGSGASIGSIYHHFASKEHVAAALYLDALADYQRGMLVALQSGARLIVVNAEPTPLDAQAEVVIHGRSGEVLPELVNLIRG